MGLKGTDGVVDEAVARGAEPVAPRKAGRTIQALLSAPEIVTMREKPLEVHWLTPAGNMGAVKKNDTAAIVSRSMCHLTFFLS